MVSKYVKRWSTAALISEAVCGNESLAAELRSRVTEKGRRLCDTRNFPTFCFHRGKPWLCVTALSHGFSTSEKHISGFPGVE